MRFHFENIGPIRSADLELGGLTLVAGRNNTGKTYVVYTMYGFLRTLPDLLTRGVRPRTKSFVAMERKMSELLEGSSGSSVSFHTDEIERTRQRWLEDAALGFSRGGLAQVFSAVRSSFGNAVLSVVAQNLPSELQRAVQIGPNELGVTRRDDCLHVEMLVPQQPPAVGRRHGFDWRLSRSRLLAAAMFPDQIDPFILSAERFGISLFYKELDFTKNRLVELLQQRGDQKKRDRDSPYLIVDRIASRYALPVKDNIDYTRSIPDLRGNTGDLREEKLEGEIKDLIGGYYRAAADEIRFQSRARKKPFDIPLHLASSSARGLSDMYFYLRHTASRNQLLVIDEPESHLDTANQIALARTLARMVRSGIKVLVTTHSDYLIKEINNLVMLDQLPTGVRRRLGYGTDDGLASDQVHAYVAEDGGLTRCTVDEQGVDMPVFDNTIDQINRVASELTARVAASARGKRQDGD